MNLFQDVIVPRHVALSISVPNLFSFFRLDRRVLCSGILTATGPSELFRADRWEISRSRGGSSLSRLFVSYLKATESFRSRRTHCPVRERDLHFSPKQSWPKVYDGHKAVCMVFSGCQTASLGDRFLFIFMAGSGRRLASEKDIGIPSLVRMFGLRVDDPNFFFVEDN